MVICLEPGADLHMAHLMSLLLTVSCFSKIQIGFTFLVPAHLGSPGQRAIKRVCSVPRKMDTVLKDFQGPVATLHVTALLPPGAHRCLSISCRCGAQQQTCRSGVQMTGRTLDRFIGSVSKNNAHTFHIL